MSHIQHVLVLRCPHLTSHYLISNVELLMRQYDNEHDKAVQTHKVRHGLRHEALS